MTLVRRRERTSMSFLRHEEIYRSDVGLGEAGNGNGCCRSQRSSAAMSFQSAIPSQGALQQSLPPLHRLETILNNQCCRTMIFQRTATTPLIPCLSPRVHFRIRSAPVPASGAKIHYLRADSGGGRTSSGGRGGRWRSER